jgi:hypothetical protein
LPAEGIFKHVNSGYLLLFYGRPALFLRQIMEMEQTKKYRGLAWLIFLGSTAFLGYLIYSHNPWLTLVLPVQTTAFVKAMDIM